LLEVKGLHFRHGSHEADILRGVSLEASKGEITTVLGPNGSGKTTLFRCIGGIWKPRQGEIKLNGEDLLARSHEKRARLLAGVPQEHVPPFPYTAFEVVLMGRACHVGMFSMPGQRDCERANEALEMVGIPGLRDKAYTRLSGGEKQLVLIGRALAQEAPIMLLDEPVSHLDFRHQLLILRKIKVIAREKNLVVLMTLHDPNLALLFSDRVVLMNEGAIVAGGCPETVITEENLKAVYGIDVRVVSWNGFQMVYPGGGV